MSKQFLDEDERSLLLRELQGLKRQYGISLIDPLQSALYRWQMSYLGWTPPVNMLRITGRPEHPQQKIPTWGYGDNFNESKLPPSLSKLVSRVREIPGVQLGELRDVTVNYRHSYFFRLDPHLDPGGDGENVFIVGLDSDVVLTLCPLLLWHVKTRLDKCLAGVLLRDEREVFQQYNECSWTPWDIDVLLKQGDLVHLSGYARWRWTHGTRTGVRVDGREGLHDWFGQRNNIVFRNHERHSVVLAFAAPVAMSGET